MSCAKAFLFFFNFIYLGISAALIYVAVWLIKSYSDITKITTDTYTVVPCGIIAGVGVLIFITALFGCCGTCRENKCCLSSFFFLLFLVFALEVAAGVLGYVYHDKAEDFVNDGFMGAIEKYKTPGGAGFEKALDSLQEKLKCCGSHEPADWKESPYYKSHYFLPPSCCKNDGKTCSLLLPGMYYTKGCLDKITEDVKHNLNYVIGIGAGLAVFQLLGMIGACYLMCFSRESGYIRLDGGVKV